MCRPRSRSFAQGLPGYPQQEGGLLLVEVGVLQDAGEQEAIQLPQGRLVQVTRIGAKPPVDERFQIDASPLGRHRARRARQAASRNSGRTSGSRTGPWDRRIACFSTLCTSRRFPGQE